MDVFDIEIDRKDVDSFVEVAKAIAPTFGGINLEDIKAPECFEIERRLKEELDIPVFHDDQHGTAIISSAGLLNAIELVDKKIEKSESGNQWGWSIGHFLCEIVHFPGSKEEKCLDA